MGRSEARIEKLTAADVEGGLALSDAAGWNQVADDWATFIGHGSVVGFRAADGHWVATAAALPYGAEVGWVSMVLVAQAWQHRGLATALMRDCVADLQARAVRPLLDATPPGAAVYRGLGFADGFAFERWQADAAAASIAGESTASASVRPADRADHGRIADLDATVAGCDRRFLLTRFLERPGTRAWITGAGDGFVVSRVGRRAVQVGPLVAGNGQDAIALLAAALAATPGPTFVDVPVDHRELAGWLERRGFGRQRSFVRMSLGGAPEREPDVRSFALAGPEFG